MILKKNVTLQKVISNVQVCLAKLDANGEVLRQFDCFDDKEISKSMLFTSSWYLGVCSS